MYSVMRKPKTVWPKNLSPGWVKAFKEYESLSGFEPMYLADIEAGEMSPYEAWNQNVRWLEGVVSDVINIEVPFDP
jgi:hypothetical protein